MRVVRMAGRFALVLLIVVVGYLFLCILFPGLSDYRIVLPGGYQLIRPYSRGNCIAGPDSWQLVGPNVDSYGVVCHIIVGHVEPNDSFSQDRHPRETLGYFILDTRTGHIWKGMSKKEWANTLREQGVPDPPRLRRPNAIRALLSKVF